MKKLAVVILVMFEAIICSAQIGRRLGVSSFSRHNPFGANPTITNDISYVAGYCFKDVLIETNVTTVVTNYYVGRDRKIEGVYFQREDTVTNFPPFKTALLKYGYEDAMIKSIEFFTGDIKLPECSSNAYRSIMQSVKLAHSNVTHGDVSGIMSIIDDDHTLRHDLLVGGMFRFLRKQPGYCDSDLDGGYYGFHKWNNITASDCTIRIATKVDLFENILKMEASVKPKKPAPTQSLHDSIRPFGRLGLLGANASLTNSAISVSNSLVKATALRKRSEEEIRDDYSDYKFWADALRNESNRLAKATISSNEYIRLSSEAKNAYDRKISGLKLKLERNEERVCERRKKLTDEEFLSAEKMEKSDRKLDDELKGIRNGGDVMTEPLKKERPQVSDIAIESFCGYKFGDKLPKEIDKLLTFGQYVGHNPMLGIGYKLKKPFRYFNEAYLKSTQDGSINSVTVKGSAPGSLTEDEIQDEVKAIKNLLEDKYKVRFPADFGKSFLSRDFKVGRYEFNLWFARDPNENWGIVLTVMDHDVIKCMPKGQKFSEKSGLDVL